MPAAARLAGFYFAYFCHLGAYVAYFPLWLEARGYTPGEIATVLALPAVMRVIAPAGWGWLADAWGAHHRAGRRGVVVALSALGAASFALLSAAGSLKAVIACVALAALFTSAVLPLVDATTLGVLGARIGGYGPVRLWGSVGFIASVLGLGMLLDRAPVGLLLPVVVVWMLITAVIALALPHGRTAPAEAGTPGLARVLREPRVMALFAACFCMTVAHGALYAFYSIYLVAAGYSKAVVGLLWTLGVLAEIALFIALPAVLRRWSLHALLLASFAAAGARFAAIGWGVGSLALLAGAQLLHALSFGAFHSAAVTAVHRLFGGALAVRGQALYASISYGLGGIAGMLLSGWAWGALGPEATFGLSGAFAIAGALLVAWKVRL